MADDEPPRDTFHLGEARGGLPTFSGQEGTFFRFMQLAEVAFEDVTSATDEKKFLKLIFEKLDGDAFEIGRSQTVRSWEDLKLILREAYGSPRTAAELLSELAKERQTGNVANFSEFFRKRLVAVRSALEKEFDLLTATAAYAVQSKLAIQTYIAGLRPEIAYMVRSTKPNSLEEAIKEAKAEEAARSRSLWGNSSKATTSEREKVSSPAPHPAPRTFSQPGPVPKDTFRKVREQTVKEEYCWYCKLPGHVITDCPDPKCKVSKLNKNSPGPRQVNMVTREPSTRDRSSLDQLQKELKEMRGQLAQALDPSVNPTAPQLTPSTIVYSHGPWPGNVNAPATPGSAGALL